MWLYWSTGVPWSISMILWFKTFIMGPSVMVKEKYGLNVSLNYVYSKAFIEAKRCRLLEAPDMLYVLCLSNRINHDFHKLISFLNLSLGWVITFCTILLLHSLSLALLVSYAWPICLSYISFCWEDVSEIVDWAITCILREYTCNIFFVDNV